MPSNETFTSVEDRELPPLLEELPDDAGEVSTVTVALSESDST